MEEIANTSFGKKIASKGADVIHVAYETFPEEIDRINKGVERVNNGLGIAITYLDTATGHTISDFWNNLAPDTQKQLRGAGKLGAKLSPLAWGGKVATTFVFSKDPVKLANSLQAAKNAKLARTSHKEAGAILNISKELDAAKLAQAAKNLSAGDSAKNIANAQRLAQQLRLESAKSPFTEAGTLKKEVIDGASPIRRLAEGKLKNPAIPPGFAKYETKTFQSPSGDFRMHFYKNLTTETPIMGYNSR